MLVFFEMVTEHRRGLNVSHLEKLIFGKRHKFSFEENFKFESEVRHSLELYPDDVTGPAQVVVKFLHRTSSTASLTSRNPKHFAEYEDSVVWNFPQITLRILKPSPVNHAAPFTIFVGMNFEPPTPLAAAKALLGMEFPSIFDQVIQLIHELILVPLTFFDDAVAPIHGSAFESNGRVAAFSGTGGVGKSSVLLRASAKRQHKLSFMADDMPLLGEDGTLHGNFAWPKIYGYNVESLPQNVDLLKGRTVANKTHFNVKKLLGDGSKVRRKISPLKLFPAVSSQGPLTSLTFLFRSGTPFFRTSDITVDRAASLLLNIMESEYSTIFDYLAWGEYNAAINKTEPLLTLDDLRKNWLRCYRSGLANTSVRILHIPLAATGADLDSFVDKTIADLTSS